MKAIVRTMDDAEYIGEVSLVQGFAKITDAELRELCFVEQKHVGWKQVLAYYFYQRDARKLVWKCVAKNVSMIVPESQIAWIEPLNNKGGKKDVA